jgi:16S rRNA pseudouridine516 synthase
MPLLRADHILAKYGYCSRREAAFWLKKGWLTDLDDEELTDVTQRLDPTQVLVQGEPIEFPLGLLVMLHKPLGYTCSHDANEGELIYDLLPAQWRQRNPAVTSVGRLDKETTGLLLVTDAGPLVQRWTSPRHHLPKTYEVTTTLPIPPETVACFASGTLVLRQEKEPCRPAKLTLHSPTQATLELEEGRYHQVRRMFASQGCPVDTLHRSRFGNLTLDQLPPGEWREVAPSAVEISPHAVF